MSTYLALPADGRRLSWERWDGSAFESAELRWDNEAWTVTSHLSERRADFVVRASPFWQQRQVLVFRDLDQPDLWLGTDGNRRWGEVNGAHRPDLDGMIGAVVDDSLLSLALPILQLEIGVGDKVELPLALIDTATLAATPSRWRFTRAGQHRWMIERLQHADDATDAPALQVEIDVDEFGIIVDAEPHCRRVVP